MRALVVRAKELGRLLNVSLASVRRMDSAGKLPMPIKLGGCVVWRVDEIKTWLSAGSPPRETWQAMNGQPNGKAGRARQ